MKAFKTTAAIAVAATLPSKGVVAIPLAPGLELIAAEFAAALQETVSLSETLGGLTREAGKYCIADPDMLDPFIDACRQMCGACGLTDGSFKVYLSNVRGVCRAMVAGYVPAENASLRAMYDAAPKGLGANKGNAGPRTDVKAAKTPATASSASVGTDGADGEENAATIVLAPSTSKADRRRAAMVELFGHADDELDAALAWARGNELAFVRYVKANLSVAKADIKPLKKAA